MSCISKWLFRRKNAWNSWATRRRRNKIWVRCLFWSIGWSLCARSRVWLCVFSHLISVSKRASERCERKILSAMYFTIDHRVCLFLSLSPLIFPSRLKLFIKYFVAKLHSTFAVAYFLESNFIPLCFTFFFLNLHKLQDWRILPSHRRRVFFLLSFSSAVIYGCSQVPSEASI